MSFRASFRVFGTQQRATRIAARNIACGLTEQQQTLRRLNLKFRKSPFLQA